MPDRFLVERTELTEFVGQRALLSVSAAGVAAGREHCRIQRCRKPQSATTEDVKRVQMLS
jgi:hypothetical protein